MARPFRRAGRLVDIPSMARTRRPGRVRLHERCVALLAGAGDRGLTGRASFFQQINTANACRNGQPLHFPAHEEVLILRNS